MNKIPKSGSTQALEILIFHKSPNWSNFPTKIMNITIYNKTQWLITQNLAWIIKNPKLCIVWNPQIKNAWTCMKSENKNKKKGKRVLPVFGERNLTKEKIKNEKTLRWSQVWIGEREKTWKTFEKNCFWKSQDPFLKKPDSRCSIDRKTSSINRTRQRLTQIFKQDFDWSKNRLD